MIYLADCVIQLLNNQGLIPGPANTRRHVTISFGFPSDYKNREGLGGGSLVISSFSSLGLYNYRMRLSKILWFVGGEQIIYLSHPPLFTPERDYKYAWAEYYLQQTLFDGTTHERTIIFIGSYLYVVGSRPMERKIRIHRMIIWYILFHKDTVNGILVHKLFVVNVICPCVGRYLT